MSENKTILTTRRFELWWRKAQAWFATQFASINVDLTPVEEKVDEVKEAVENINVESADQVAQFFGLPEALPSGYEFMTDTEVTDELEDIMQALDPELEQEVEYPEGSGTYMTKAQAITAEAMQIINPSQS